MSHALSNAARVLINQYIARVAELNGVTVADVEKSFVASPSIQQTLWQKVQESSAFLTRVNMPIVAEMSAELIGMGIAGTISGRTNTDTTDRLGTDPGTVDNRTYDCKFTEFDVSLKWAKLDMWAKFPNFQIMWATLVANQIALELIMVGWHGTSAAAATNRVNNPLLQDVNIGWLQKQRTENAARVLDEGEDEAGKVTYGTHADADYKSLDSLVYDARHTLLPAWAKNDTNLVAICNSGLLHDKYFPLVNKDQDAQNTLATDIILSSKRLGGLQAVEVPHFPDGKIFITRFDNLSIYQQEGKNRRHIIDNPKRSRIEDYQSMNLAYVIEDLDFAVLIENIEVHDAAAV